MNDVFQADVLPPMTYLRGERGERPVFLPAGHLPREYFNELRSIPGVVPVNGGFRCTWDIAWAVAALLKIDPPKPPLVDEAEIVAAAKQLPGLAEYRALGFHEKLRAYQKKDAVMAALLSSSLIAEGMRTGKSLIAIAAAILRGAPKVLVVCPALPKLVWAEEIAKWAGEEAVICEGRAGKSIRIFCKTCMGRGKVDGASCPDCRMLNGQSRGLRKIDATHGTCTKHQHACPACAEELQEALHKARFIIANPEILIAQKETDAQGGEFVREDLEGWTPTLSRYAIGLLIADEGHQYLRGFNTDETKKGTTVRDRANQLADPIPHVIELTGTPQFGFVRDWWGQMDFLTKGAASGDDTRLPFKFHVRYPVHVKSRVLCGDLRYRAISDLSVGDEVWGWIDTHVGRRVPKRRFVRTSIEEVFDLGEQRMVTVVMEDGRKVTCTPDHYWYVVNAARKGRWVRADQLMEQQYTPTVLATDMPVQTPAQSINYMKGYVRGLMDGDGTARDDLDAKGHRRRNGALRMKDLEAVERFVAFCRKIKLKVTRLPKSQGLFGVGISASAVAFFLGRRGLSKEFMRGWLAGVWDAEGTFTIVSQYRRVNPDTYAFIERCLRRFDFRFTSREKYVDIRGGRSEFFRFVQLCDPAIRRKVQDMNRGNYASGRMDTFAQTTRLKVADVRRARRADARCVKTGTGNLVIEGLASKNCDGHHREEQGGGWIANGSTVYAENELPRRLEMFVLRHPDSVTRAQMPPKTRQIIRIDEKVSTTGQLRTVRSAKKKRQGKIRDLMLQTAKIKMPYVVDNVLNELGDGRKCMIVCFNPDTANRYAEGVKKGTRRSTVKTRMRQVNVGVWCASGEVSLDKRRRMGKQFVEHSGAGVFVMTIDAFQVGVSLKGATSEHWVDVHHDPSAMLQAEDRPYERGTKGLAIMYYAVRETIDEHRIDIVMPKLEALQRVMNEKGAGAIAKTLTSDEIEESFDDQLARLTAHLEGD